MSGPLLLILLIVPAATEPSIASAGSKAQVFRCTFDEASDRDYDGWPDGWSRRRGPGYPPYVKAFIAPQPGPSGGRSLRIELDGGAAALYSPPLPVAAASEFVLTGQVRTEGLQSDVAYLSVTFLDDRGQTLETRSTEKVCQSRDWKPLKLDNLVPASPRTRFALVGVHLEPGQKADLTGAAQFADLELQRLPRMRLYVAAGHGIYPTGTAVAVECEVSGLAASNRLVDFNLVDEAGGVVAETRKRLETRPSLPDVGRAAWTTPPLGPGLYRLRAARINEEATIVRRELKIAVIAPQIAPLDGEFGWSFSRAPVVPQAVLADILRDAGVNWVKFPVDSGPVAQPGSQGLPPLIDQLSQQNVETVGVILDVAPLLPPTSTATASSASAASKPAPPPAGAAAAATSTRRAWAGTTLDLVAPQVRWWQLGADNDSRLVGSPQLAEKVEAIRSGLNEASTDARLGLPWLGSYPLPTPPQGSIPWRFLSFSAAMDSLPQQPAASPFVRSWITLKMPAEKTAAAKAAKPTSLADRAAELVKAMVSAKTAGYNAIFAPDPFDPQSALLDADGGPGELFVPWRTAALALAGAKPAGTMPLPGGSVNQVFARSKDAVLVVWNPKGAKERLALGGSARHIDLWGRTLPIEQAGGQQAIEVGPCPSFILGMDRGVSQWCLNFTLGEQRIPSIPRTRLANRFRVTSPFSKPAEVKVTLTGPEGWQFVPDRFLFAINPGEMIEQPFSIELSERASAGPQQVQVEFDVTGDRPRRFRLERTVEVGSADVRFEIRTRLGEDGNLLVEQRTVNTTDKTIAFECQLLAPDRRRVTANVALDPRGEALQKYSLPDGRDLLGKTLWLQAREVGGPKVLNYRAVAQ
jgi:hypothetical protein